VQVSSHEHAAAGRLPLQLWLAGQAVAPVATLHPLASTVQVETLPALAQNVPAAVQPAGAALQAQAPAGSEPVQVWLGPQVAVPETNRQPFASAAQVDEEPAPLQKVPGAEQPAGGALHVQAALGIVPVQVCRAPHVVVADTNRHPSASVAQVVAEPALAQNVPACVQPAGALLHVQAALLPDATQEECVPHAVSALQTEQPEGPTTQLRTPPPGPHCLVPMVQAGVHD
jgi:hypothetical protein